MSAKNMTKAQQQRALEKQQAIEARELRASQRASKLGNVAATTGTTRRVSAASSGKAAESERAKAIAIFKAQKTIEDAAKKAEEIVSSTAKRHGSKKGGKKGAKTGKISVPRGNIEGITKPAIRRIARRAGVKRISGLIYAHTRPVFKKFIEEALQKAMIYTSHKVGRRTVTARDVVYGLKQMNIALYGFGA
jgi:histone H4